MILGIRRLMTVFVGTLGVLALLVAASPLARSAEAEEAAGGLALVYLDAERLAPGEVQSVALLAEDGAPELAGARVGFERTDGSATTTVEAATVEADAALVELPYDDDALAGSWRVGSVELRWADGTESRPALPADGTLDFTLAAADDAAVDVSYAALDGDERVVAEGSLGEALEAAGIGAAPDDAVTPLGTDGASTRGVPLIALDPGHGGRDSGAGGFGFAEKDANWAISMYTKEWLEAHGVPVFVTHAHDETPNPSIYDRVERAIAAGATVFISQHNNSSSNPDAQGAEIYIPYDSSFNYFTHLEGQAFADRLAPRLQQLGLAYRGTKTKLYSADGGHAYYPNGDEADYYGVIRYARRAGITGILVEHAFVDSNHDAPLLRDDNFLRQLGYADAEAIYEQWVGPLPSVDPTLQQTLAEAPEGAVFRMINPFTGEHLFTTKASEVLDETNNGWQFEKVDWLSPAEGTPVYRLYNPYSFEHFYTMDVNEYETLPGYGWLAEDVAWYSPAADDEGVLPVYRLFNPFATIGTHHFTTDANEYQTLAEGDVWNDEGILCYGLRYEGDVVENPPEPSEPTEPTEPSEPTEPTEPPAPSEPSEPPAPSEPGLTPIMGQSASDLAGLQNHFTTMMAQYGKVYPAIYAEKGAATPADFVSVLWEQATAEGVRPDVLLAQVILETGWLQFGGDVQAYQCNFGGIGATDGSHGVYSAVFPDVATGLRAQAQHLKAYASTEPVVGPLLDPRYHLVEPHGKAPYVEMLGNGNWATSATYAQNLLNLMAAFPVAAALSTAAL